MFMELPPEIDVPKDNLNSSDSPFLSQINPMSNYRERTEAPVPSIAYAVSALNFRREDKAVRRELTVADTESYIQA
jgi:hypothetical protein